MSVWFCYAAGCRWNGMPLGSWEGHATQYTWGSQWTTPHPAPHHGSTPRELLTVEMFCRRERTLYIFHHLRFKKKAIEPMALSSWSLRCNTLGYPRMDSGHFRISFRLQTFLNSHLNSHPVWSRMMSVSSFIFGVRWFIILGCIVWRSLGCQVLPDRVSCFQWGEPGFVSL